MTIKERWDRLDGLKGVQAGRFQAPSIACSEFQEKPP